MAVVETDLYRVVSYLRRSLGRQLGLVHGQQWRSREFYAWAGFLLFALIVAGRAGTIVPQKRKVKMAGVPIRPDNVHAHPRLHVDLHIDGLFALV